MGKETDRPLKSSTKLPSPVRRAVIDVGTNSVKLLVADVAGPSVQPVHETSRQTRLGRGFYETHRLQPEPIARTAAAVRDFAALARRKNAVAVRVIATSATREAVNREDLTRAIHRAAGLATEIITGEREAKWAFQGVATAAALARQMLLLLDVGGGSTEFILGCGRTRQLARSFPLGTVRLLEKFPPGDPPAPTALRACRGWLKSFFQSEIGPWLNPALGRARSHGAVWLVGTGGTAGILARVKHGLDGYDRDILESSPLTFNQVAAQRRRFWRLSLAERRQIPGLPKQRADVMLTGALIYETVMAAFGFAELRVSTRGLRFAAVRAATARA